MFGSPRLRFADPTRLPSPFTTILLGFSCIPAPSDPLGQSFPLLIISLPGRQRLQGQDRIFSLLKLRVLLCSTVRRAFLQSVPMEIRDFPCGDHVRGEKDADLQGTVPDSLSDGGVSTLWRPLKESRSPCISGIENQSVGNKRDRQENIHPRSSIATDKRKEMYMYMYGRKPATRDNFATVSKHSPILLQQMLQDRPMTKHP